MSKDKLTPEQHQEMLDSMREVMPTLIASYASYAITLKAKHDALMQAGFTKDEALEIVKAHGMGFGNMTP